MSLRDKYPWLTDSEDDRALRETLERVTAFEFESWAVEAEPGEAIRIERAFDHRKRWRRSDFQAEQAWNDLLRRTKRSSRRYQNALNGRGSVERFDKRRARAEALQLAVDHLRPCPTSLRQAATMLASRMAEFGGEENIRKLLRRHCIALPTKRPRN